MTPRLSQHFLHDRAVAARIAAAVSAPEGALVVEIGPGRGALTEPLLERDFRVLAIELDRGLAAKLRERWGGREGFELVEGDARSVDLRGVGAGPLWVVGNLPYAITSPILFRMLDQVDRAGIAGMVFMIQREVADRLAARPGTKEYGALTVGVRLVADVERLFDVGPGAFRPPPTVVSTVVRITPHDRFRLSPERRERLRGLVRDLFGQRRKQIQKSLRTLPARGLDPVEVARVAERSGLDLSARPETLSPEGFLALDDALEMLVLGPEPEGAFSTPEAPPGTSKAPRAPRRNKRKS
ncbi:MAG TPA: 16S rRNA (adenine(1518)-N(6)/adenine(1519)-N(6))-dimethyltransferase RsmA [Gemmatimonadota bacterium]|nr:16S rRNA (adenine(1518)-N(6)/adenine(1519)-N(6))-dimethyltransferase RsmA [Gemmatimonadota bacterium]